MGIYGDCKKVINDKPPSTLTALEREVLYARIRAFSVRVQYIIWNIAGTVLLYLFNGSLLNGYIWDGYYYKIITFHCIQTIAIIAYFCTSLSNPGYIDLNENENALFEGNHGSSDEDDKDDKDDKEDKLDGGGGGNMTDIGEWNKNIIIDPNNAPFNFCWRCKFVRPIRSKHCYDCDRCIAKFDHHCPMVGNCVGGRNHRYFLLFMLTQTIVVVWAFYMSLNTLFKMDLLYSYRNSSFSDQSTEDRTVAGWIFRILFFICMFFALFVVVGLSGFHCYLASTNQTTYEMIKPQVAEKWREEEEKRESEYRRTHKPIKPGKGGKGKKRDRGDKKVDIDDDSDQELGGIDDDGGGRPRRRDKPGTPGPGKGRKWKPPVTFDQGFHKNVMMFWTGNMKEEWQMPYPCILKDSDTEDSD